MSESADAARLGFDAGRLARIDRFLDDAYLRPGTLPHVQLLLARDGQPVHRFTAGTLRADGTPMRDDAIVRIASMTKPVTSVAFMQLVEQARVALDDPIATVLPELADLRVFAGGGGAVPFATGSAAPPIRFVDLLTHMAGFTYGFQERNAVDAAYRAAKLDFARDEVTSDAYIAALAGLPLLFAPGTAWNYSVATDVLGIAVERLSGLRLEDYFAQHIFDPLGMRDTAFHVPPEKADRLADCYAYRVGGAARLIDRGDESRLLKPGSFDSGGGGLLSTVADYHRLCTMLLNRGELAGARILAPKTVDLMVANHLPGSADLTQMSQSLFSESTNAGVGFGLGFATVIDPPRLLIPASRGEFYWGGAYSTAFFVDPVERITCVFATQLYPSSATPIRRQLRTLVYAALENSYA
ncbi:class A beta-lactamase-related serine hydrolase [Erythrobacteraceae bacterium CFH 75059]|uniref:serine hydrolase domain-containing protein n=1 Tax=Qipengyuania thermophila TaxID=2509361 RepID=UPI00101E9B33|nr:serine hydrolase domain-containing protein [Qipengyuania thermophila]TCD04091.1 class A beta-lactamase-related serine hydrolase [Erythrobacteraceae bacterium CFH 75059]